MSDPTPIPVVPNLCTKQSSMTAYVNYLNTSFDIAIKAMNEELDEPITIPGIPQIPLGGLPEILVPAQAGWNLGLRKSKPPQPSGFIGRVFPIRNQDKRIGGNISTPDLPGFGVDGVGAGNVPGLEPSELIIKWVNMNYEMIVNQLDQQGVVATYVPIPYVDICGGIGPTGQPSPTSPVQVFINELIRENLVGFIEATGGGGCVPGVGVGLIDFTNPCWVEPNPQVLTLGAGSIGWSVSDSHVESVADNSPFSEFLDLSNTYTDASDTTQVYKGPTCQPRPCSLGVKLDLDYSYSFAVGMSNALTPGPDFGVTGAPSSAARTRAGVVVEVFVQEIKPDGTNGAYSTFGTILNTHVCSRDGGFNDADPTFLECTGESDTEANTGSLTVSIPPGSVDSGNVLGVFFSTSFTPVVQFFGDVGPDDFFNGDITGDWSGSVNITNARWSTF